MKHNVGHIKKGDIVYIPFPLDSKENIGIEQSKNFENDPRETKERLGFILWKTEDSFVVCAITSKPHREHKIELRGKDLSSGEISYDPSFIRPNIIQTIPKSFIRRRAGTVKPEKLKEVIDKVKEFLDLEPELETVPKALERVNRRLR